MWKKIISIVIIAMLICGITACGKSNTAQSGEKNTEIQTIQEPASEEKILIAYFSLSDIVPDGADAVSSATPSVGNTEMAAMEIQKQVGGDLFAIKTEQDYPVSHSEASAIAEEEMKSDARPELTTHMENMDQYDTIYLGFPIWWYVEPMAIRTFLEEYDFSGKTIFPFCTSLGAGISESEEDIASLAPGATVQKGITLHTGTDDFSEDIADWISVSDIKE